MKVKEALKQALADMRALTPEQLRAELDECAGSELSEALMQASSVIANATYVPRCSCCGTTENLHRDFGSGGPYRCNSYDCVSF